jgi:hypothetical protein
MKKVLCLFVLCLCTKADTEVSSPDQSNFVTVNQFGAKGDGKSDDTVALQQAIDYCGTHHRSLHVLSGQYVITRSLIIGFYPGLVISGEGWLNTEIRSKADGQPILRTTTHDTHSVVIERLKLSFAQPQPSQSTDSYGIEFSDNSVNSNGFYHWILSQIWIENATVAVGEDQQSKRPFPIWGCRFQDLLVTRVSKTAILLKQPGGVHAGQPSNSFDNIKVLNKGAVNSGPVLDLIGEWRITNLDVEDCQGTVVASDSSFVAYLGSVHIERQRIDTSTDRLLALYDGDYRIEGVAFHAYNKPGNAFCFVHSGSGNATITLNGLSFGGADPQTYADVSLICGSPRTATVKSIRVTANEDKIPPRLANAIRDQEIKH